MNNILFTIILFQLLIVSYFDLRYKKISNKWIPVNILFSILFHFIFKDQFPLTWEILIFPVGIIVFGFLFFLVGIMGAGDSKYLASLYLVLPLNFHLNFLEKLLTATIVVGILLLSIRVVKNFSELKSYLLSGYWVGIKNIIKSRYSYAPVMLLAFILLKFI